MSLFRLTLQNIFAASVIFTFGVVLSPAIVPILHEGIDRSFGCKGHYEAGVGIMETEVFSTLRTQSATPEVVQKVNTSAQRAYAHFQEASWWLTPLGADALMAMAAMHCSGIGFDGVDIRRGQLLIDEAGRIPEVSPGRIFNAILTCRRDDI